jgi:hypothetical protein
VLDRIGFLEKMDGRGFIRKSGVGWTAPRAPVFDRRRGGQHRFRKVRTDARRVLSEPGIEQPSFACGIDFELRSAEYAAAAIEEVLDWLTRRQRSRSPSAT